MARRQVSELAIEARDGANRDEIVAFATENHMSMGAAAIELRLRRTGKCITQARKLGTLDMTRFMRRRRINTRS